MALCSLRHWLRCCDPLAADALRALPQLGLIQEHFSRIKVGKLRILQIRMTKCHTMETISTKLCCVMR